MTTNPTDPVLAIAGPTDHREPIDRAIEMMKQACFDSSVFLAQNYRPKVHDMDEFAVLELALEALLARKAKLG